MKTFYLFIYFFFFGDHLTLGEKIVQISDFGWKITLDFGEDLFFLEITWFWAKKSFEFPISAEKSLSISVKTFFFFGNHLILGEKIVRISDFGWKITLNFGEDNRTFEDLGPPQSKILATPMRVSIRLYLIERDVWGSNLGLVDLDTLLLMVRHC